MALATAAMMVAGTGMGVAGSIMQGREENKRMRDAARERLYEAAVLKTAAGEKAHELAQERSYALGSARAGAAKAGVKGTGSVKTQRNRISAMYTQKIANMGLETGHRIGSLEREARELKRRGRSAKRAGYWGAGASLLSGGAQFGSTFKFGGGKLLFR